VPADVEYTLLVAHGARAVADNLAAAGLTAEDCRRARLYTWSEFDGSMYLQQNPVEGFRMLLDRAVETSEGKPVRSICVNHWRTAENRTAIRYAARAMIDGPIPAETFYTEYGRKLGLRKLAVYAKAMAALDDAATRARDELFNIGFCFYGTWGREGLGKIARLNGETIRSVRADYAAVRKALAECLGATDRPAARDYLDLMINQVECTELHLEAIETLTTLQPICADKAPDELTDADRAKVRRICTEAERLTRAYMVHHARRMPDRGCEGTLINYLTIPPRIARRIADEYAGKQ
jgi:hypothetical protein